MSGRRIFVGDVQGCLDPLQHLLREVAFDASRDRLYLTGDLVERGPDSLGVLRLLRELDAHCVLGNHDLRWLELGRIQDDGLARWLGSQPIIRELDDLVLVHAGLHPRWDDRRLSHLRGDDVDFAVSVRYCDADGNRPAADWPPPDAPYRPWDDFYRLRRRVVFGHWARRGLERTENVVALDSGCVSGGPLSAWIAEDDRVVQVPGNSRDAH